MERGVVQTCPRCGTMFVDTITAGIGGPNVHNVIINNSHTSCPACGAVVQIRNGIYDAGTFYDMTRQMMQSILSSSDWGKAAREVLQRIRGFQEKSPDERLELLSQMPGFEWVKNAAPKGPRKTRDDWIMWAVLVLISVLNLINGYMQSRSKEPSRDEIRQMIELRLHGIQVP